MVIAVDFDGTCVSHEFPAIGEDIGAVAVLKELVDSGNKLILFTMRSNGKSPEENYLDEAVNWFKENDIPLFGIQKNPTQGRWTSSPKCYAKLYIDDAALGCPLIFDIETSERPFVDWDKVRDLLVLEEIIRE
ncbi:MAG: hypothetical protein HRT89_10635 [Lentisphaeria bacterium]|nr:hypothetical protein [Lentisphaeria bacterium]NQZ68512.1 hypothetical protein [Lentisphaeria bacterium]